ncbi:SDR family oxidoreductase [Sphingomonas montanisoli]|uniref:SDR family oxidoreductase n=2 Tax=Sphingomonas montanisoli TaxID=2606412 RepID=A0A5D9CCH7_9SPHN|nr:SDR family oxidoreductase [Sphingomonas montanisoli]
MSDSRVALITGGTRGIGKATADRLLADGWRVVVCGRTAPADEGGAVFIQADIRDAQVAEDLVAQVKERFGRLDLLVNNAGGSPNVGLADSSAKLVERVIALNLLGPIYLARAAHAVMVGQAEGGSVINIASVSGKRASPGTVAYGAAKAGLLSATSGMAMEWGPKVRVNAIIVGLVEAEEGQDDHYGGPAGVARISDMLPMKRMAWGADIANAVAWLASDQAAYVSGAELAVHGGGEVPAYLGLAKG